MYPKKKYSEKKCTKTNVMEKKVLKQKKNKKIYS